ncbi:MAG: DUF1573 domain-containing protein [Bacteroidales bacterium]|nr:DUF1573 domain-containing protein [Bacteroidales bacterium]
MKAIRILALGLAVMASFAVAEVKAQATSLEAEKTEGPSIKFDNTTYDYGQIEQGANGDCEFTFSNVGTEPLLLSDVRASCGCTTPSWTREPIMPGKTGTIKVHYDTNRLGGINKAITVTTNGNPERVVLRIAGNVSPKEN